MATAIINIINRTRNTLSRDLLLRLDIMLDLDYDSTVAVVIKAYSLDMFNNVILDNSLSVYLMARL